MVRNGSKLISCHKKYTWGQNIGGGIGGLLNLKEGSNNYTYLYDGKGNVMAVLDNLEVVQASYRYDEFGNLKVKAGILNQPYQFSTKRYDELTGLSYYGYRFYNPSIGRWMTRDPLGETGGINLYGFVGNNVVNAIDPWGLSTIGKILPKVIRLIKGRKAVKATSVEDAVRLYKEGENFVACSSKDVAKEAARKAGKGSPPIHEIDAKTGSRHYHPRDRSGHFLYSFAGALTFSHYAKGRGYIVEGVAFVGDLFNPLSIPQDILDIKEAILE